MATEPVRDNASRADGRARTSPPRHAAAGGTQPGGEHRRARRRSHKAGGAAGQAGGAGGQAGGLQAPRRARTDRETYDDPGLRASDRPVPAHHGAGLLGGRQDRATRRASTCTSATTPSRAATPSPAAWRSSPTSWTGSRSPQEDVAYLAALAGAGRRSAVPGRDFLDYLAHDFELTCDVDAVAEGTVVFPHEPLVRVCGPIMHCQLLETALLELRELPDAHGHQGRPRVLGRRRCSRGGVRPAPRTGRRRRSCGPAGPRWWAAALPPPTCWPASCSTYPVSGTHAHSWVMSFPDELTAFRDYARGSCPRTACFWWIPTTWSRA